MLSIRFYLGDLGVERWPTDFDARSSGHTPCKVETFDGVESLLESSYKSHQNYVEEIIKSRKTL
jgi:hypothetical protein